MSDIDIFIKEVLMVFTIEDSLVEFYYHSTLFTTNEFIQQAFHDQLARCSVDSDCITL